MTPKCSFNSLFLLFINSVINAQKEDNFQSKFLVDQLKKASAKLISFPQKFSWKKDFLDISQVAVVSEKQLDVMANTKTASRTQEKKENPYLL